MQIQRDSAMADDSVMEVDQVGDEENWESDENETPSGPITRSRSRRPQISRRGRTYYPNEITPVTQFSATTPNAPMKKKRSDENSSTMDEQDAVLPTKTRLSIRINKANLTAAWRWKDVGDDTCGICRSAFEACCVTCKTPGDECPLVIGNCKHAFHMHCIHKWTEAQNTARPQCPLCRQEWKQ